MDKEEIILGIVTDLADTVKCMDEKLDAALLREAGREGEKKAERRFVAGLTTLISLLIGAGTLIACMYSVG